MSEQVEFPERPTEGQILDACVTFDHGFGLLDAQSKADIEREAKAWWRAIYKVLTEPSYLQQSPEPLKRGDWVVPDSPTALGRLESKPYKIDWVEDSESEHYLLIVDGKRFHNSHFRRARPDEIPQASELPTTEAPLQLREGAWYVASNGQVFGPMAVFDARDDYWHVEANDALLWCGNGKEILPSRDRSPLDLIREVPAPSEPAEPTADADGWIEHDGGKCPVDGETLVECKVRNGGVTSQKNAAYFRWSHCSFAGDITHYRLAKPTEQPPQYRPFASAEVIAMIDEVYADREKIWNQYNKSLEFADIQHASMALGAMMACRLLKEKFEALQPCGIEVK